MSFIPYIPGPISLRVADRKLGDQTICQVAQFVSLFAEIDPLTNELSAIINTRAVPYEQLGGVIGGPIPAATKGVSSYPVPLYANNNCAVYFNPADPNDPQNGRVLYYRKINGLGQPDSWQVRQLDGRLTDAGNIDDPAIEPRPLMLQGNALREQMKHDMKLENLILWNIEAANQPPFNYFS